MRLRNPKLLLSLLPLSLLLLATACRKGEGPEGEGDHGHAAAKGEKGHDEPAGAGGAEGEPHGGFGPAPEGEGPAGASLEVGEVRGVRFLAVPPPQAEGVWLPAEAISDESAQLVVSAPVAGVVTALHASPGSSLKGGAPVATLRSPELGRLAALRLQAQARLTRAAADLARERRLSEAGAGSRRDLESAEAEEATARAESEGARLALEARGVSGAGASTLTLRAPRAGTVAAIGVLLGESVAEGREVARLQAGAAALARIELPLPAPASFVPGAETEVRRGDGQRWTARVEGTPALLSPETRRLSFRLRLAPRAGAPLPLPGTPLEARVVLAEAPILPQAAVQQIQGTWGVFVRDGDRAVFRPVRRGLELGGDVMILDGVRAGETVAVEGAYLLKSMWLKRQSGGEEHDH